MDFLVLNARKRQEREGHSTDLVLRVHRALSWLQRADLADDADDRFIFLWIAFNAAYATDIDPQYRLNKQEVFKAFLGTLCDLDNLKQIDLLAWQRYAIVIYTQLKIIDFEYAELTARNMRPEPCWIEWSDFERSIYQAVSEYFIYPEIYVIQKIIN